MTRRRAVIALVVLAMWVDVIASAILAAWNRWRVLQDAPPALVPGPGARIGAYLLFIAPAVLSLWVVRRADTPRYVRVLQRAFFVLLLMRALAFGAMYPWGARDLAELVSAKHAVDMVADEGTRFFRREGRVATTLEELSLPDGATKDPWGFNLGYVASTDSFRVFVRGAPRYITGNGGMARRLSRTVVIRDGAIVSNEQVVVLP